MAIDHVLRFPCEVRKSIPEEKLRLCVNYRSTAESVMEAVRQKNPAVSNDELLDKYKVGIRRMAPDGTTEQAPVTIRELFAMAQPLDACKDACTACPANTAARPFGCIAKINYPVTSQAEAWLLSRLPEDANDPGLSLLFKFLSDLKVDGRKVDSMREPRLFEMKQPVARRWGGLFNRKQITSSQILQILAFEGYIGPEQARLYTSLLKLESVLSDPHPPSSIIEQFKTLMCAIVMAGRLNAGIDVDA
jgi:hypothetical protein